MNTVKHSLLAAAGILTVILVAGCFNPAAVDFSFPEAEASGDDFRTDAEPAGPEPFEVTIYLDAGGGGRAVLGPSAARIEATHIRNFIQVFLLDTDTKKVVEIFEHRRLNDSNTGGTIVLSNGEVGKTYKILMLQGHWERKYIAGEGPDDNYVYDETKPPTLLYAGVVTPDLTIVPGPNEAKLTLYPIWVDTQFALTNTSTVKQPVLGKAVKLDPGAWSVWWTVKKGTGTGSNGFTELTSAQVGSDLFTGLSSSVVLGGTKVSSPPTPTRSGNTITLNLSSYIGAEGNTGSANFNLKYAPFSLSGSGSWTATSGYSVFSGGVPVWIIRNGVNDAVQNRYTTFVPDSTWSSTANGNGAVAFTVQAGAITVYKTYYVASSGNDSTGTGTSTAPLATVQKALAKIQAARNSSSSSWPGKGTATEAYADIVITDTVTVENQITIDNTGSIYPPIRLTASGEKKLQATRAIGHGKSLLQLLNGARVTLAGDLVLAGLDTDSDADNRVQGVYVGGSASVFTMTGGEISGHFAKTAGGGVYVNGGTFILSGGEVTGNTSDRFYGGGGVYVSNGTFVMNGGTVSGNKTPLGPSGYAAQGGGVLVTSGTFTMEGGGIYNNTAPDGGGVCMNGGTFTMNGGKIYNNYTTASVPSSAKGGGVLHNNGTFIMTGGEISGNSSTGVGGGVFVSGGTAEMSGGTVSGNTAGYGKEVAVEEGVTFIMYAAPRVRVLLCSTQSAITIGGPPLTGTTVIDLGLGITKNQSQSITDWVGIQILKPDGARGARFTLGQAVPISTSSLFTVTDIPATYTIGNDGKITQ
jgi:hypothetical protein